MNGNLSITINKIKSIKHGILELPMNNGLYAIVGNNGIGKSTIIYSLAQLISKNSLSSFGIGVGDGDSYVEFEYEGVVNRWKVQQDKLSQNKVFLRKPNNQIKVNGMYEGSLFFGFRFQNYDKVKKLIAENKITEDMLTEADSYIVEQLGFILHGNKEYYSSRKIVRIKNKEEVIKLCLDETPYFCFNGTELTSQYGMSSGECIMLSLLHFIYHSIIRRSLDPKLPVLMLIDELEVALHPVAVFRFMDLLCDLTKERDNLIIYITSHSPEVIKKIEPRNMFKIEIDNSNEHNTLNVINPCYPSYAIRDVFQHDGYDWLLLVEDKMAKIIIDDILLDLQLLKSKLVHVLPVGGWQNVLSLQYDLFKNNILGVGKQVISILDGDVKHECEKNKLYNSMPKYFLPISSVEKYLKNILVDNKNPHMYQQINDALFQITPLSSVINNYINTRKTKDINGKLFYSLMLNAMKERSIDEQKFVTVIASIIKKNVDFSSFNNFLTNLLR